MDLNLHVQICVKNIQVKIHWAYSIHLYLYENDHSYEKGDI